MKNSSFPRSNPSLILTGVVFCGFQFCSISNPPPQSRRHLARTYFAPSLGDILIGLTIYLKTSIDFAVYIGRLMAKYPGWKNRVMMVELP